VGYCQLVFAWSIIRISGQEIFWVVIFFHKAKVQQQAKTDEARLRDPLVF